MITGVENFGLFVTGTEIPAEGFVHISSLTDDYYRYDRAGHMIAGHRTGNSYRLGDTVRVAVAAVDVDTRSLDFRLIARGGAKKSRVAPPSKSRGKSTDRGKSDSRGSKKVSRPGKHERGPRKHTKGKPGGKNETSALKLESRRNRHGMRERVVWQPVASKRNLLAMPTS